MNGGALKIGDRYEDREKIDFIMIHYDKMKTDEPVRDCETLGPFGQDKVQEKHRLGSERKMGLCLVQIPTLVVLAT